MIVWLVAVLYLILARNAEINYFCQLKRHAIINARMALIFIKEK
jgi:hypothetical protein